MTRCDECENSNKITILIQSHLGLRPTYGNWPVSKPFIHVPVIILDCSDDWSITATISK